MDSYDFAGDEAADIIYRSESVQITDKYVETASGERIFTKLFEPKDKSKATAMICHCIGFEEHISWLNQNIGVRYAEMGFVVFMYDHLAFGKSDGAYLLVNDFKAQMVDTAEWIFEYAVGEYIRGDDTYRQSIDEPSNYFMSGHSMGGTIVIRLAMRDQQKIRWKGVVTAAPMIALDPARMLPRPVVWLLQMVCKSKTIGRQAVLPATETLSRDAQLQKKYDTDPLAKGKVRLTTALELLDTIDFTEANATKFKLPLFVAHGSIDPQPTTAQLTKFLDSCGKADASVFKTYAGKGHLVYEEEPAIFKDATEWILSILSQN